MFARGEANGTPSVLDETGLFVDARESLHPFCQICGEPPTSPPSIEQTVVSGEGKGLTLS